MLNKARRLAGATRPDTAPVHSPPRRACGRDSSAPLGRGIRSLRIPLHLFDCQQQAEGGDEEKNHSQREEKPLDHEADRAQPGGKHSGGRLEPGQTRSEAEIDKRSLPGGRGHRVNLQNEKIGRAILRHGPYFSRRAALSSHVVIRAGSHIESSGSGATPTVFDIWVMRTEALGSAKEAHRRWPEGRSEQGVSKANDDPPIGTGRAAARIPNLRKNGKHSGGFFKELRGEGICGVDPLDLHAVSIFKCSVVNPALG